MREVHRQHQHVRDALVALRLEVMLGHPQRVLAELVHQLGDGLGLVEHAGEMRHW